MDYNTWLNQQATSHSDANTRAQAKALLGWNGQTNGSAFDNIVSKMSLGYSQNSLSNISNNFKNMYNADMKAIQNSPKVYADDSTSQSSNSNNQTAADLGYYGSGSGSSGNYATAAQLAEYDQGIGQLEHGVGRLDTQLGIAIDNIAKQYGIKANELASSLTKGQNQYGTQTTQNQQDKRTNFNNINDRASSGLRGLIDSLGSMGAVGSDLSKAGQVVQDETNLARNGANQTYAKNQQTLDTNWNTFKDDIENEKKKAADWQNEQRASAESQSATTRQSLLNQIAQLRAQKASAMGANGAAAARADLNAANALSSQIDNLARINPTYTGQSVNYTPQSLDSYTNNQSTQVSVAPGASAGSDPTINMYNAKSDDDLRKKNLL